MRIGLVTTSFPRFDGDHCGAFLLTMARELVLQGYEVRVLAPAPPDSCEPPRWPGIEVAWVRYAHPPALQRTFYESGAPDNLRLHPSRWLGAAAFTAALRPAVRAKLDDCDALVSSWCVPSGWIASELARGRNHLCLCHETDLRWLAKAPLGAFVARRIASGASSMWFLSATHRRRFFELAGLDRGALAAHVGPMPVDRPIEPRHERCAIRRRLGIEGFTLLFLGRLVPVKGVEDLLRAAAAVSPAVHLRIAGDGPEHARLSALAQALGVDAVFEGWVHGEHKEALLRACDVMVVPSRPGDGLPTVLLEARARGLPVIATRTGAVADYLDGNPCARLVTPFDTEALVRAIACAATGRDAVTA